MKAPVYITSPQGLDIVIQDFQTYLTDNLIEIEYCFGRYYKTETADGFIPEVYIGDNEYQEIFTSDKVNSHLFFDVDDTENIEYTGNTNKYNKVAKIRLIVSANLNKIYSTITHRGDENLIVAIENKIKSYSTKYAKWTYSGLLKKTANVFANYSYTLSDNLNDMQPYFVCAFEFDVVYSNLLKC